MNFFSEDKKSTVLHNRTPLTSEPWKLFALQLSYRHDEGFLSAIKYNAKIINIPVMDHYSYLCREFGYSSKQKAAHIPLFHYLKDKIHDNRKNKH